MSTLLNLLLIGLWAVNAQENAMGNVPKSLLECYNDTYLLNRNNKLPNNAQSLLAIIRKIEDNPELNMDIRTLSVALLHRFRQDGIVQYPFVRAQDGVTPYAPNGLQFYRHAETLRLIPGNAVAFPNNSISSVERCSLHAMLSSSIEFAERGDESSTCRGDRDSAYRYPRRIGKGSATESSDTVDDVETLTAEEIETMSKKDEAKDNGIDPNWWYPPLPPNHPDRARVVAMPPTSKCPVENGVIRTNWGAVAAGSVLAGIAAGLQPQNVRLGDLLRELREEWRSRGGALSSATLDNKWIATVAGDLAEVALRQGPLADEPLTIGVDGRSNSTYLPRWFFLNSNENLIYTAAEIRGDIDGLILATEMDNWYSRFPNLKLSQILDMYYSERGVFNATIRACNRKIVLTAVAPNDTITQQAYRSALVLREGVAKVTIDPATIERFAVQASEKLFSFIASGLDDGSSCQIVASDEKKFNPISTDLTIFLDTNWPFDSVQPILAALLENLEINKYNSNFALINAHDGKIMINGTNSILDFYHFNQTHYSSFSGGFDLSQSFDTIRILETAKLDEEQNRGLGGRNSEIVLIVPYTSTISDADKEYCLDQLKRLREDMPDVTLMFLTYGSKDKWSDLTVDPSTDIFSVGTSGAQDFSVPIDGLLSSIKRVPRRLINSQCGASYSKSGSSSSYDDYLEPMAINFYRLHPNYFYATESENVATVKGSVATPLTVCTSREALNIDSTSASATCTTINGDSLSVALPCGDASYIHECNPFYMSVFANITSLNAAYRCTDERLCRYPDMTKYTISYENLECLNSAATIALSPLIVIPAICSYIFYCTTIHRIN